jgi:predicted TIM-barrel fold metal-dependent hydrolase
VLIISADCHAGATVDGYKEYLARRWWDDFDAWKADFVNPFADLDEIYADRNWDSQKRVRHLEEDGIAAEVIFPNTVPPFFPSNLVVVGPPNAEDYERRWAGLRAHNRWLADFCADVPGRRAGIAQLMFNNPQDTVGEITWAREHGLFGGVIIPAIPPGAPIPPIWDASYDPIWAACCDLDVPVNHHGGSGTPDYGWGPGMPRLMYLLEFAYFSHRVLWQAIWGGVFERHPKLRWIATEQGFGDVLDGLRTQDGLYAMLKGAGPEQPHVAAREMLGDFIDSLPHAPSEYARRNVWFGVSFMGPAEVARRHEVGPDRMMWGADYPHTESTWPNSRASLVKALAGLPEQEAAQLVGGNAVEVYGFDRGLMESVAERVCPADKELMGAA